MSNAMYKNLPPGFRFHPTDEELIIHYLQKKVSSPTNPFVSIIADIDLYKLNPWELPGKALFGDEEWFFFTPRDRKYPNGARPNRTACSGYWKATGTDQAVLASGISQRVGLKKSLVFYEGRSPKGVKTDWTMHEYRLLDDSHHLPNFNGSMRLDDFVLCRVHRKTGNARGSGEVKAFRSPIPSLTPCYSDHDDEEVKTTKNCSQENYRDKFQAYAKASTQRDQSLDNEAQPHLGSLDGLNVPSFDISIANSHASIQMSCFVKGGHKSLIRRLPGPDVTYAPIRD